MIATGKAWDEVAATITPAAAAAQPWQVVVVGAGPAGATAAWRLAAHGLRVLLVDRHGFPRAKVCGCCLSMRAVRELAALDTAILDDAAGLDAVRLAHRGRCVRVPFPGGCAMSRDALDARLIRHAIAAGCHWLPGVHVAAVDDRGHGDTPVTVALGAGAPATTGTTTLSAGTVVLATGLADHVRIGGAGQAAHTTGRRIDPGSRIGVGAVLPAAACGLARGELVMAVGRDGYCGIVRLEDGRIDVAAALDRVALAGGTDPAAAVAGLLDEAVGLASSSLPAAAAIRAASFRATPQLSRRAPLVAGASFRILRTGDAAGYVEPFTGEGIGWALASGRILAESLLAAPGQTAAPSAAARYVAAHRREFAAVHARCRLVARGLRRPTLVAAAVATARALPWAAHRLVPAMIGAVATGARP